MANNENEKYKVIVSALPDLVFILTESGYYADILGGQEPEFYHDPSALIGLSLYEVLPAEQATWFIDRIHRALDEDRLLVFDYSLSSADITGIDRNSGPKGVQWYEGRVKPLNSLYNGERAVVWVARNISERHNLEVELRYQSEVDVLTDVYNRRKLFEQLEKRYYDFCRYNTEAYFLLIDIDNFKYVNDQFGHNIGDQVIQHVTRVCRSQLRSTDIFGRLGGDEFGVILPNSTVQSSVVLAERLQAEVIRKPFKGNEFDVDLTLSIGISTFWNQDSASDAIYHRADKEMYISKNKGKNRVSICTSETSPMMRVVSD